MKNRIKILLALTLVPVVGAAQGKDIQPPQPHDPRKDEVIRLFELTDEALDAKLFKLAEERARLLKAVELTMPKRPYYGPPRLGQALFGQGRYAEAKAEFKSCMFMQLGMPNHAIVSMAAANYGQILAMEGKWREAKALYYAALFRTNQGTAVYPVPFLIAFDPDPDLTVWELNLTNYEIAFESLVGRRYDLSTERLELFAERVGSSWPYIHMRLAELPLETEVRASYRNRALAACRSEQERQWVQAAIAGTYRSDIANDILKNCVLKDWAKAELEAVAPTILGEPEP